ncbi:MAG: hypothetical protein KDM91_11205 [Verrucomicrobiae bacterium]|nr:hypothetical protein [Verrucomicrobiae bacterium]MCP5539450.1 hypothetical protein [Akkermansiaceae bacterium]
MKPRRSSSSAVPALLLVLAGVFSTAAQTPAPSKRKAPEGWENDIAKFEAADRATPPPKDAILFLGSSSIRLWDLKTSFPDRVTINRGFGGSTLPDTTHFFDRIVLPYRPRAALVYAGDNDVASGSDADAVLADFKKLAALFSEKLPGTPVIYIAIKPSVKRWAMWPVMKDANAKIAQWCDEHEGFFFADISRPMLETADGKPSPDIFKADGLHLNEAGYAQWKSVIDPLLEKALAGK